jgi:hypothetical protein
MAFEYQLYLCLMLVCRLVYLRKDEAGEWWLSAEFGEN